MFMSHSLRLRFRPLALACFTLAACGGGLAGDPEFTEATPEPNAYMLEITGDDTQEAVTPSDYGVIEQAITCADAAPPFLADARAAVKALNQAVGAILHPIAEIARNNPKVKTGTTHVWGPTDKANVTWKFTMKKIGDKRFAWKLEGKPVGGPDSAYVVVMGGTFARGLLPHRGRGVMGIDLDKLAGINSSFKGQGQLLVGFAHVGDFKVLNYGLKGFTPDSTQWQPVSAIFHGWKNTSTGVTDVRVATHVNLENTSTMAKEFEIAHARWLPGKGGRVDAVVFGGDVPQDHAIVIFACYTGSCEGGVKGYLQVSDCTKAGQCTVLKTEGQKSNCAPGLETESLPPSDPNAAPTQGSAPENPEIPGTIPSGEG